ncbi:MAG: Uma2 family endonuclease [Oscillospiraceae bacterium]|nr:Uma2 family endonuclease [Oscillospiraceae bacterium]
MTIPNLEKVYTYSDYLNFPKDERWEILDGVPYMLSAPLWEHQAISSKIVSQLDRQLEGSPCLVFAAPFDLKLTNKNERDEDISTVVQPDILVICDKPGLKGTGYKGVPEFVIEILSDSTARYDMIKKLGKYEKLGIKEYWIIDPEIKRVFVFVLNNGIYGKPDFYFEDDKIKLKTLENIEVDLGPVFNSIKR